MSSEIAKVCLYDERFAEAFDQFCRIIWPHSRRMTPSLETPATSPIASDATGQRPPTFLFVKGDRVVGHVTTIPVRLAAGTETIAAHWIVGFMVLPEYRNGLVGPLLIKEVNRVLGCALSLHVEPPVLRILTGLRWIHQGVLPQYLRILNARQVATELQVSGLRAVTPDSDKWTSLLSLRWVEKTLRFIGGGLLALGQAAWDVATAVLRRTGTAGKIVEERSFDHSYDELWKSVGGQFGAGVVRDQAHLNERFGRHLDRYRVLACRQGNALLGYCIVTSKVFHDDARMGNMKIGTIVDCLFHPNDPSTLQTMVEAACRVFRQEGVHAVFCTASHAAVRKALVARGFLKIPGNLNFACHAQAVPSLATIPLDVWHLMRGDSDSDQNF